MNLGLGDPQKIYLGSQEVSKIYFQNIEVLSLDYPTQNLIAYWSYDNSTAQSSVSSYNFTFDGGTPNYISGKYNLSLNLTSGKRFRLTQNLWNVKTNPLSYSVSFWVKPNQLANTGQETVLLGSCFGNMGFFFTLCNIAPANFGDVFNQHVNFWLGTTGDDSYKNVLVPFVTTTGIWYHITGTYNLATQTAKLYINGNLVGTTTNVLNNNCINNGWTGFCLNGSPTGTTGSEYGKDYDFDMVGIWTKTLNDQEIQTLYNNYIGFNNAVSG